MKVLFVLIPILVLIAGLMVYRHNGKKEILRFDSVQFFYAFVLMPVLYVWCKSVLFFTLQSQFSLLISQTGVLFWDTIYSVLFLFLYAFTVVHSLTKSFKLKLEKDPLYDLLEHSEYYHLWVTHVIIYVGLMVLFTLFSALNIWIHLPWDITQYQFYSLLGLAAGMSGLIFFVFLKTDIDSGGFRFLRLMELFSAVFFVAHIGMYIFFEPQFSGEKALFWFQFTVFLGLSLLGLVHDDEPIPAPLYMRIKRKVSRVWRLLRRRKKRFFNE